MKKVVAFLLLVSVLIPGVSEAYYSLDNFWTSEHEAPAWFMADGNGGFYGETVAGTPFSQKPVLNNLSIRLHKFAIDDAFFYISDRGAFHAENDIKALSIYFTLS
jgi:hypothetical protein